MSNELKEVIAIIRPDRWRVTQQSIFAMGATGVTQKRVLGRGQQSGLRYLSMIKFDGAMTMGYLPKRIVRCVVEAGQVEAIVEAIIKVNQTGHLGDGKIFVCPIEDGIRIRTGEKGKESIRS